MVSKSMSVIVLMNMLAVFASQACLSFFDNFKPFHTGLLSEPKWGHLKDLHAAIKLCEDSLVAVDSPHYVKLGPMQEVRTRL